MNVNLGYARGPADLDRRGDLYHFSLALTLESGKRLIYIVDSSVDTNPDRAMGRGFSAITLIGAIYTIRPGLDVDAGFRGRLNGTGPARQWLLGITFRGAP